MYVLKSQYPQRLAQKGTWTYNPNGAGNPVSSSAGVRPKGTEFPLYFFGASEVDSAAMKASWGTSTRPTIFIRFLPSFCFSSSLRLRLMSPP